MGMTTFYSTAFPATEAEARADELFDAALAAGCNTVVTARLYHSATGGPHNEELVGRQFKRHGRNKFVVVTKIGVDIKKTPPFVQSPDELRAELAASLAALGTSYIDLLILNRPSPFIRIEDSMAVFKEFIAAGTVRYVGLSEATPAEVRAAHAVCPLSAVEQEYSLLTRDIEGSLLPTLRELGIGLLAYAPLSRGLLAKSGVDTSSLAPHDFRRHLPRFTGGNLSANLSAADALAAAAGAKGCTPAQLAIAWVAAQGPDVVPVPGTTSLVRLSENLGAAAVKLSPEEEATLRAAVAEGAGERYAGMHGTFNAKEATPEAHA
jgi:aryl-alcohol dehydrogenase-like predicted oxidoreductase